jgi:hypothetical protein
VRKQRDNYKTQLKDKLFRKEVEDYHTWGMSEAQLDDANEMSVLSWNPMDKRGLNPDILCEIAMEIYHRPAKYIDTIKQFIKARSDLWNEEVCTCDNNNPKAR